MSIGVSSAFGKKKGKSKSKQDVTIPDFLRPFVNQSVGVAGGITNWAQLSSGLSHSLGIPILIKGFNEP